MLRTLKDLFNAALPPQAGAAASENPLDLLLRRVVIKR